MKRSAMPRSTTPMKRTPMRKVGKRRQRELPEYSKQKREAFAALTDKQGGEFPLCEVCVKHDLPVKWMAIDWHHWHPVGQGGPFLGGKMFCVCRNHHDWIHQMPGLSRPEGWLK